MSDNMLLDMTYQSAAAVPAFRYVTITGDREVTLCGAGERPDGISQTPATAADQAVTVRHLGVSWLEAAEDIDGGENIASDVNGRGVVAGGGDIVGGVARTSIDVPATPLGTERVSVVLTGPRPL